MSKRRLSSEERKKEILDIALKIIYQEGFYNLTIRNIADKIDISEAAIYRHFKNKKEIIDNLTDLIFNQNVIWDELEIDEDPFKLLEDIMVSQLKYLQKNPYLTAITFQEEIFREYPDIKARFNRCRSDKEEKIRAIIKSGQQRGLIIEDVDPTTFAILYLGSIRMSVLRWKNNNFSYSLEKEAGKITKELFKILKKRGD